MEAELRGEMTDEVFREKLIEYLAERSGKGLWHEVQYDPALKPWEVVMGLTDARMGLLSYTDLRSHHKANVSRAENN